jgi:serine phosphatase RsbU (regulator of sigma subunit)/anti-sigma regulatory factor (Ser/Thr protein kinase)
VAARRWSVPLRSVRRAFGRSARNAGDAERAPGEDRAAPQRREVPPIEIPPGDPLVKHLQAAGGAIDVQALEVDSPALRELRAAGVKLVVPLITQGELIGMLNLGPRLSEQDYSGDDRRLLESLAAQAAPALRIGQLVREQAAEVRTLERIEQELRVAQLIQQNFLPRELPQIPGWQLAAHYAPAREVGGDFYDFIDLPEGQLGLVIGDVTDKGVPAAMVMAATRSVLRATAPRLVEPAEVLARVNELLCPDVPEKMFVTCLYAVLDPWDGRLRFANAGHDLPYLRRGGDAAELRATGLPLGLFPGVTYEEREERIGTGDSILLSSDGLAEAHDADHQMYGFERIRTRVGSTGGGSQQLIDTLLADLGAFTPIGWEQEDDITIVAIHRGPTVPAAALGDGTRERRRVDGERVLAEFEVASKVGGERSAIARVEEAVAELGMAPAKLERLKTAVGEATMNAIEHGNEFRPDRPVAIRVRASAARVWVDVTDEGGDRPLPEPEIPDLDAKLAGLQRTRGWGLFLIERMVDEMQVSGDGRHHTVELAIDLGENDGG